MIYLILSLNFFFQSDPKSVSEMFLKACKNPDVTMESLRDQDLIKQPKLTGRQLDQYDEFFQYMLDDLRLTLDSCQETHNEPIEFLTLQEARELRGYDENLIEPTEGDVILSYCSGTNISIFLVENGKVNSISTMTKGERVYLLKFSDNQD